MRMFLAFAFVLVACTDDREPEPEVDLSCVGNSDCDSTHFCDHPGTSCTGAGECRARLAAMGCVEGCAVVGCDGLSYASACAAEAAGVDYAFSCARGETTHTLVIDGLTAARVDPVGDPTIIEGFDLDGRVSDRDDEDGCLWEDRTSPPPESEMGVDNMLGPTFDAFLAYFAEDLDFGPQIARGMHLIVIEIRQDGDAVQLDLSEVVTMDRGAPVLDDDGRLVADQELELVRLLGRIEGTGGTTIEVGPGAADLPILATHPDTTVLDPFRARVRMQDDGTAEGVLGGGIDVEAAAAFAVAVNPEAIPESVARSAASAQADLAPDAEGNCTRISGAWTFTAVPARIRR